MVSVGADELALDVRGTSDKRVYPKGRASVPRAEVTHFRIRTQQPHRRTVIGSFIGFGFGIGAALAVNVVAFGGSQVPLITSLSVAGPTAIGGLIGWAAEKGPIEVTVEPEDK